MPEKDQDLGDNVVRLDEGQERITNLNRHSFAGPAEVDRDLSDVIVAYEARVTKKNSN